MGHDGASGVEPGTDGGQKSSVSEDLDLRAINTIRSLSIDMIQAANSGHPGTPLGAAPVAYALWNDVLRYDPADPLWPSRDRFVLSAGHASALLYSLLHLSGVSAVGEQAAEDPRRKHAVTLDDLRTFRQLGSVCPGHPEYGLTSGVETTTGPLGQGLANSVGMALAGRWLAARYDRGAELFGFDVWALAGDGCLMEGIAAEAASLAGHQQLSNLCWIYDRNQITIDGSTDITFTENVPERFASYGWSVVEVADANDLSSVRAALESARAERSKPTLVIVQSHIGFGSPVIDSPKAHGEALGPENVAKTKEALGLPLEDFFVDPRAEEAFAKGLRARGEAEHRAWVESFNAYRAAHPDLAHELESLWAGRLPDGWDADLPAFEASTKGEATRASSSTVLNALSQRIPWLVGGSADLAGSTKTWLNGEGMGTMSPEDPGGRNINYGIREHAAAAVASGLALCGLQSYWATFLIFSDYARPAMRLSALMELPVLHVFTHDSIGVGEDGPTHQPIEHVASLRAMPNLWVFRPADSNEVTEAWKSALSHRHGPSLLALSRQNLPVLDREQYSSASGAARGAYVLAEATGGAPSVLLLATGSEVALALEARSVLEAEGIPTRVVSMPCLELFAEQDGDYRASVLPPEVRARVSIELGAGLGWDRFVGDAGEIVAMTSFGASAPASDLATHFGFTTETVVAAARRSRAIANT